MENEIPPTQSPPAPPLPPPPVIMPTAPQPPPRRRGRGWMILAIILLVLLSFSLLGNLGQLLSRVTHSRGTISAGSYGRQHVAGPRLEEMILEDNEANSKIAVIEVEGIITSRAIDQQGFSMVDLIKAQLDRAKEDRKVKAVILKVDSPGGEVLASDEIYNALNDFEAKSHKPVITSMGNLAASGGYYISSASSWIVANEMTITGSIGVIMHTWNYRGLMDKIGLAPVTFKSGKFKDMLSGSRAPGEIPPEEREMMQSLIDETYNKFKSVVRDGREASHKSQTDGQSLSEDWESYADGRILSGTEAYKLGFVDQLGNFDVAVERAKTIAHIPSANVVEYKQRYDLADFFRIFGESKSDAKGVKIDLGIDTPKIEAGQLYFLSPVLFH